MLYVLEVLQYQIMGDLRSSKSKAVISQQYFLENEKDKAEEIMIRLNAHFCALSPDKPAEYEARLLEVK